MGTLADRLLELADSPRMRGLVPILCGHTELSSGGYPYLAREAFVSFRDGIPHLLNEGQLTLSAVHALQRHLADMSGISDQERESFERAFRVIRTMVYTAAITAPSDLWLLRIILGTYDELGLRERLLAGEAFNCAETRAGEKRLDPKELKTNMSFLRARACMSKEEGRYMLGPNEDLRQIWQQAGPVPEAWISAATPWAKAVALTPLTDDEAQTLQELAAPIPETQTRPPGWRPLWSDIELGFRLIGIVLGLYASGHTKALAQGDASVLDRPLGVPGLIDGVKAFFQAVGFLSNDGLQVTDLGRRAFGRGPAPYGIIDSYRPYMARLKDTLLEGRGPVWVERTANVAASQEANRKTFVGANDALDAFCEAYGFSYSVFVEHAMGRGEAIRQRWNRPGGERLHFFGADLEDASIDAATQEQSAGHLPEGMKFIRNADIARADIVAQALRRANVPTRGAVMMVGNGFHEVREQTDEKMVSVFRGYHDAGFVLLFTEASALSVTDLLETAYNTYHAGFKYVHEKSGQGLRPATPVPAAKEHTIRASWNGCATRAGYVRVNEFCRRSRTIYPYNPADRHNPAISVTHFFIPGWLATQLGVPY